MDESHHPRTAEATAASHSSDTQQPHTAEAKIDQRDQPHTAEATANQQGFRPIVLLPPPPFTPARPERPALVMPKEVRTLASHCFSFLLLCADQPGSSGGPELWVCFMNRRMSQQV